MVRAPDGAPVVSSLRPPDARSDTVPRISEFFGIRIYIHWRDHGPPHFHAVYAEYEAQISIDDLAVLSGKLPPRALSLVIEWATIHQDELRAVWEQAVNLEPLSRIDPLD